MCQVLKVITPQHLKQLAECADSLQGAGQRVGLPYRSLAQVVHCYLITLLRDVVTGCPRGESE